jgi:hypothetical protein
MLRAARQEWYEQGDSSALANLPLQGSFTLP